LKEELGNE